MTAIGSRKFSVWSVLKLEQDKNISANIDCEEVLNLLPGPYQDFVEKADIKDLEDFENKLYRAAVVGSDKFMERIKEISKAVAEAGQDQLDGGEELFLEKKKKIRVVYILAVSILVFLGASSFLLRGNANLKREIKKVAIEKDEIFNKNLIASQKEISQDLEEKYRADMISYKAAALRLQQVEKQERQKAEVQKEEQKKEKL